MQLVHPRIKAVYIVGRAMVLFVEPPPLQTTHVRIIHGERSSHPVNHRAEIAFQPLRCGIEPVLTHVGIHAIPLIGAHPFERTGQNFLPLHVPPHVMAPLLQLRVLRITKNLFSRRHEWSRIDGIQKLLGIERHARYIDGPEPLLDFLLLSLACVNEQLRIENTFALLLG